MHGKEEWVLLYLGSQHKCVDAQFDLCFHLSVSCDCDCTHGYTPRNKPGTDIELGPGTNTDSGYIMALKISDSDVTPTFPVFTVFCKILTYLIIFLTPQLSQTSEKSNNKKNQQRQQKISFQMQIM